ncbi:MAG: DUF5615 family PIN-like protein [Armatimonadetes bacterium]|nr:DUF5615 family PIN-like protein [Armatimonadota bacterium]
MSKFNLATRFLVDENLASSVADALRTWGFEDFEVRKIGLRGADDMAVFKAAQDLRATLITADKGFGDIRRFALGTHYGIVIVKVVGASKRQINALKRALLIDLKEQELKGALVIVTERKTCIRR